MWEDPVSASKDYLKHCKTEEEKTKREQEKTKRKVAEIEDKKHERECSTKKEINERQCRSEEFKAYVNKLPPEKVAEMAEAHQKSLGGY